MGESSSFIIKENDKLCNDNDSIEKINAYSNKESINKNKDIISLDNNNFLERNENNDLLYSKIYEYFLLLPLIKFFILISQNIFVRYNYYHKGAIYKNFYLVTLDTGQILFSVENNFNLNNGYHPSKNTKLNNEIWKELLYYGNLLKYDYIEKYGKILDFIDYQHFFIRIELRCTHPRVIFIVRFMPLLNGIILIYEYHMNNYSIEDYDDEKYKEIDVLYGNSITREEESEEYEDDPLLINEPRFLKEIEYFFINFFLSTNSNLNNFFYIKNSKIKYFSDDILNIINKNINKILPISNLINIENIILTINNELYNEYLQINNEKEKNPILIGTSKVNYKNIFNSRDNNKEKEKDIIYLELLANDNNKIINQFQWNYVHSPYIKNLFQIEEKFILIIIFNYRKGLKNNELTMDLSKIYDNYSMIEKENKINNREFNKYENNIYSNEVQNENLSELLDDKISEFTESQHAFRGKNYFKDKKNCIKKSVNKPNNKIKENLENNKASDEDKSKDKINILYDNERSSLFNLDFTCISKNDIALSNSSILDKDNIDNKNNNKQYFTSKSLKKTSLDRNPNEIGKVNTLNLPRNSLDMSKKKIIDINGKIEEKPTSNLSFIPAPSDKSYNGKDKSFKKSKKQFLDKYYETISSSCDNFYKYDKKISNNNINEKK